MEECCLQDCPADTDITEVNLSRNELERIPQLGVRFPHLTILNLASNSFQVVPGCISELKMLKELNLSRNCLTSLNELKFENLSNLENFLIDRNEIHQLPPSIGLLRNLKWLSVSGNHLTDLPDVFHSLKNLECLNLNNNCCGLPSTVLRAHWITALHVRSVGLTTLPDGLRNFKNLRLLATGGNKVRHYPHWLFSELSLENLKLGEDLHVCIPPPVVCRSKSRVASMRAYYESLSKSNNIFNERMKVLFIGDSMAGKTSLVKSIVQASPTLTAEESRTACVEICDYLLTDTTKRSLTLNFWDFGGHESYYSLD